MAEKKVKETKKITKEIKEKKKPKKQVKKVEKKKNKAPKERYLKQVKKELKLVKWPTKKEVLKYTIATIVFCLIISAFFILLNFLMSLIKGMFA